MATINVILLALAVLSSGACMVLLFRAYAGSGTPLLLWSALCFVFLTANNALLFCDVLVFPDLDLRPWRIGTALAGILFLLYGFIREAE
jgi:hypothetical protein